MPEYPDPQISTNLSRANTPGDYHAAARRTLDLFDQLQLETAASSGARLACREGCSLCCWLRVDVFAHEVFLVAYHVTQRFTAAEQSELMERLTRHSEAVLPLTPFEHATRNIVCPLLKDGRCSVYAVRPHSCRRHHSTDLTACEYTFENPLDLEFPGAHDRQLFRTLSEAMGQGAQAYADAGFDTTIYELGTALAEALTEPSSWRRWRSGKKAFLRASVTPAG